jgi:hypothetical protein
MHHQLLRDPARLAPAQDVHEIVHPLQRSVQILMTGGRPSQLAVVAFDKARQENVGRLQIAETVPRLA